MVTDIADVVRGQIIASTWMDESTKKVSLEKLKTMRKQLLIPDWFNNEAIDKYYNGVSTLVTIRFYKRVNSEEKKVLDISHSSLDNILYKITTSTLFSISIIIL